VNYPFNGQEELSIKLQLAVSQNAQPSTHVRSETQSAWSLSSLSLHTLQLQEICCHVASMQKVSQLRSL